jgi:hypothetical protein
VPAGSGLGAHAYAQAAADAGRYGLYAGTQIPGDLAAGRRVGAQAGAAAWTEAERYFGG